MKGTAPRVDSRQLRVPSTLSYLLYKIMFCKANDSGFCKATDVEGRLTTCSEVSPRAGPLPRMFVFHTHKLSPCVSHALSPSLSLSPSPSVAHTHTRMRVRRARGSQPEGKCTSPRAGQQPRAVLPAPPPPAQVVSQLFHI